MQESLINRSFDASNSSPDGEIVTDEDVFGLNDLNELLDGFGF